jgi:hypothetical protein
MHLESFGSRTAGQRPPNEVADTRTAVPAT